LQHKYQYNYSYYHYQPMLKKILLPLFMALAANVNAQNSETKWNTPCAGNPFIPGYFADPTIRKFGDTYYLYATTDGTGNGYGPAQVWVSKDFVNWRNVLLNWPTTEVVWAPDVVQQPDGTFRYYYCTPCEVRVGESNSPVGPWKNRLGKPDAVLVPDRFVHNAITLDPALFRDDDGSEYLYFGTWGIYKDFGCGVAKLAADGKSFTDKKLILNTEITDFFEAPFVFKRNGVYYFTYSSGSCHDDTYRVQYATSTAGPMGPYQYKGCILKTNADGTIHGPGHHSVLVDGDNYYIVYHRHNNPHSIHGFHRQICIDRMEFDTDGNILPVIPTHSGVIPASLQKTAKQNSLPNLAFGAKVEASSTYSEWFKPEYAVDDNNGTLWRSKYAGKRTKSEGFEWLQIDLGKVMAFNQIWTQFEYATFFYQYLIQVSDDGKQWRLFADQTKNVQQGSPMIDKGEVKARFIRITITDTQKNGHFPAIWNIKVYNATKQLDPSALLPSPQVDEKAIVEGYPWIHKKDLKQGSDDPAGDELTPTGPYRGYDDLINAAEYEIGKSIDGAVVVPKDGKAALRFTGKEIIRMYKYNSDLVYNAPYALTAWILNPEVGEIETVAQIMPAGNDLATIELRNGKNRAEGIIAHNASFENAGAPNAIKTGVWQHWAVVFDGFNERIYCDGKLVSEKNIFLMLRPGDHITIGAAANGTHPFTGYLHRLRIYHNALTQYEVEQDMKEPTDLDPTKMKDDIGLKSPWIANSANLEIEPLTPTLLRASVFSNALRKGVIEYQFATGNDTTALRDVPSISEHSTVLGIQGKKAMAKLRDIFGYEAPVKEKKLKIRTKDFIDQAKSINAKAKDGRITLESAGTNLTANAEQNGPIESVELTGNFVAQCRIVDMTGMERRNTPAYNEGGLIIVCDLGGNRQSLLQLGAFPNYNCGNMLTVVNRGYRPQYNNSQGWNFDPWLQLERRGDYIHARTSKDCITWTEMPNSPVNLRELFFGPTQRSWPFDYKDYLENYFDGKSLRVGIYQTTYSDNRAAVTFDNIEIWQKKP